MEYSIVPYYKRKGTREKEMYVIKNLLTKIEKRGTVEIWLHAI